jgi:hypothetical protein
MTFMAHSLTGGSAPRKIAGLEAHFLDDQVVVFKPGAQQVTSLNPTAALVFELCDGNRSVSTIVDLVREAYGLMESPADEVMTCLASLSEAGIIE